LLEPTALTLTGIGLLVAGFMGKKAYGALVRHIVSLARQEQAKELADHKAALDRYADLIKHTMSQEYMRAEMRLKSLHRIYPRVASRMHYLVGGLKQLYEAPLPFADVDKMAPSHLGQYLDAQRLPEGEAAKLKDAVLADRPEGIRKIKLKVQETVLITTEKRWERADETVHLNRLYMSNRVLEICVHLVAYAGEVLGAFRAITEQALLASEVPKEFLRVRIGKTIELLVLLDRQMRRELSPSTESPELEARDEKCDLSIPSS
jgi:hypothetical protein